MSPDRKKHLGVLIAYGTEVRSFVYSGLLEELSKTYRITIFALKSDSRGFNGLPRSIMTLPLPLEAEHTLLNTWRYRSDRVHALWLEKLGIKRWRYTLPQERNLSAYKEFRDLILRVLSSSLATRVLFNFENLLGRIVGTNINWECLFKRLEIDAVLSLTYINERALPALQTAINMGLKTLIFMHTWKEIFVKPHLPIKPSKIMVWSQMHVDKLIEFNPWVKRDNVCVTGSLHLEPFAALTELMSKEQFYHTTGLDPQRPYICYTAAGPEAVVNEEGIVAAILEAIRQKIILHNPQLLLRINPMEDGERFKELEALYALDLVIQKPEWEWYPEINWNCPLKEDSCLWISTAYHAALNISIPSTVTLEFAAIKRPVINVCYDIEPATSMELSNRRYWYTDWYSEIRLLKLAIPAFSEKGLFNAINKVLNKEIYLMKDEFSKNLSWLYLRAVNLAKIAVDEEML